VSLNIVLLELHTSTKYKCVFNNNVRFSCSLVFYSEHDYYVVCYRADVGALRHIKHFTLTIYLSDSYFSEPQVNSKELTNNI
jgi:hypothetical protein